MIIVLTLNLKQGKKLTLNLIIKVKGLAQVQSKKLTLALVLEVTSLGSLLFAFFLLLFMVSSSCFLSLVIFEHCNCWEFKEHFPHRSPCSSHNIYFIVFQGGLEIICEDGMWHIDRCPLNFVMKCFALQKNTSAKCVSKITSQKTTIGTPTPYYSNL